MPTLESRVADLERELQSLRAWTRSGAGSSTYGGATTSRPLQVGFPAKITSTYSAATGYNWSMRLLTPGTATTVDPTATVSGNGAVEVSGRTDIASGTKVWMEPDPNGRGFLFTVSGTGGVLTVKEVDGAPSISNVTEFRFDQTDGFVVSNPAAGVARVDMASASTTQAGVVDITTQAFAGDKTFEANVNTTDGILYVNVNNLEANGAPFVVYAGGYVDGGPTAQPAILVTGDTTTNYVDTSDRQVVMFGTGVTTNGYPGELRIDGVIKLLALADADVPNDCLFNSSTGGKWAVKDSGGTVHYLW